MARSGRETSSSAHSIQDTTPDMQIVADRLQPLESALHSGPDASAYDLQDPFQSVPNRSQAGWSAQAGQSSTPSYISPVPLPSAIRPDEVLLQTYFAWQCPQHMPVDEQFFRRTLHTIPRAGRLADGSQETCRATRLVPTSPRYCYIPFKRRLRVILSLRMDGHMS